MQNLYLFRYWPIFQDLQGDIKPVAPSPLALLAATCSRIGPSDIQATIQAQAHFQIASPAPVNMSTTPTPQNQQIKQQGVTVQQAAQSQPQVDYFLF